ncbi:hypothetical protein F511_18731 [Dorcoceras hygrometricum]|uniref:Uncharacterized protein n=1 Tax=Dorcoceras hygrometricum TaxID=472368 RepID=A0A2Z7B988_9LAMI|nr:hypothetical protein F511_18731 [Dorcoceras hygrometricum]
MDRGVLPNYGSVDVGRRNRVPTKHELKPQSVQLLGRNLPMTLSSFGMVSSGSAMIRELENGVKGTGTDTIISFPGWILGGAKGTDFIMAPVTDQVIVGKEQPELVLDMERWADSLCLLAACLEDEPATITTRDVFRRTIALANSKRDVMFAADCNCVVLLAADQQMRNTSVEKRRRLS